MEKIKIIPYHKKYKSIFKSLNEEWISHYFQMEEVDYKVLDYPEEYILSKGGSIFVGLLEGEPLGVCALIKMEDSEYDFELAKMAVSPIARGKYLGFSLATYAIEFARNGGAKSIFLETNSKLAPAIALYKKLGFKDVPIKHSPYSRVDIQMALQIKH